MIFGTILISSIIRFRSVFKSGFDPVLNVNNKTRTDLGVYIPVRLYPLRGQSLLGSVLVLHSISAVLSACGPALFDVWDIRRRFPYKFHQCGGGDVGPDTTVTVVVTGHVIFARIESKACKRRKRQYNRLHDSKDRFYGVFFAAMAGTLSRTKTPVSPRPPQSNKFRRAPRRAADVGAGTRWTGHGNGRVRFSRSERSAGRQIYDRRDVRIYSVLFSTGDRMASAAAERNRNTTVNGVVWWGGGARRSVKQRVILQEIKTWRVSLNFFLFHYFIRNIYSHAISPNLSFRGFRGSPY